MKPHENTIVQVPAGVMRLTTPFAARIRRVLVHFITCASVVATPQT